MKATMNSERVFYFLFIIFSFKNQVFARVRKLYDLNFDLTQQTTILNKHNEVRASVGAQNMQKLVWNPILANLAKDWASQCRAQHRSLQGRSNQAGFQSVGENIWWLMTEDFPDLETVVETFYEEYPDYNYDSNACLRGQQCGHYVQVAWADTCSVGCGVAWCDQMYSANINWGHIVVCNYGPGYAFPYEKPYALGKPCESCPGQCKDGLCANHCNQTSNNEKLTQPDIPVVAPKPKCRDNHDECENWASTGECTSNSAFMQQECRKSCHAAPCPSKPLPIPKVQNTSKTVETENIMTPITDKNCINKHELCDFWALLLQCETNPAYMLVSCRKACSKCAKGGMISAAKQCSDEYPDCPYWSSTGDCRKNPLFMRWKCRKSCGLC